MAQFTLSNLHWTLPPQTRSESECSVVRLTSENVSDWYAQLAHHTLGDTAQQVLTFLKETNQIALDPKTRLSFLTQVVPQITRIVALIAEQYQNRIDPLTPLQTKLIRFADVLQTQWVLAHKWVITTLLETPSTPSHDPHLWRALETAQNALCVILRRSAHTYQSAPKGTWYDLHRIHYITKRLLNNPTLSSGLQVPDADTESSTDADPAFFKIETRYKQILLFFSMDPYQWGQFEQDWLFEKLFDAAQEIDLIEAKAEANSEAADTLTLETDSQSETPHPPPYNTLIFSDQDTPPQRLYFDADTQKYTPDLKQIVQNHSTNNTDNTESSFSGMAETSLSEIVSLDMRPVIAALKTRCEAPHHAQTDAQTDTHTLSLFQRFQAKLITSILDRLKTQFSDISRRCVPRQKITGQQLNCSLGLHETVGILQPDATAALSPAVPKSYQVTVNDSSTSNESKTCGMRVTFPDNTFPAIEPGQVVGLQSIQNTDLSAPPTQPTNQIAVVRWIRHQQWTALHMGVSVLDAVAMPVQIQGFDTSQGIGTPQRALLLVASAETDIERLIASKVVQTLIAPALPFWEGESIRLFIPQTNALVKQKQCAGILHKSIQISTKMQLFEVQFTEMDAATDWLDSTQTNSEHLQSETTKQLATETVSDLAESDTATTTLNLDGTAVPGHPETTPLASTHPKTSSDSKMGGRLSDTPSSRIGGEPEEDFDAIWKML